VKIKKRKQHPVKAKGLPQDGIVLEVGKGQGRSHPGTGERTDMNSGG